MAPPLPEAAAQAEADLERLLETDDAELSAEQQRDKYRKAELKARQQIAEMQDQMKTLTQTVNNLTGNQQLQTNAAASAASLAIAGKSGIVARTTLKTPELQSGMTYRDYEFEVNAWSQYAEGHIAKKDMGWLLLNHMPPIDDKMIKRTIIERLGHAKLKQEDSVKLILAEMQKIVECEPFTRLVEWLKGWESLSQGSKSYEKYTTILRRMVKSAADDFGFQIPQQLQVAKLLYGAKDVNGSNISLITSGFNLNGQDNDSDLYATIEAKLKTHIGTNDAFTTLKSHAKGQPHQILYTRKDVYGEAILDSPEKEAVPSLTNHTATSPGSDKQKEFEAFLAYQASQAAKNNKSKKSSESREARRERLLAEGRCFEVNCESKTHVYEDCPKRKIRLDKKRKEVEARGEVWYDNPAEAKKQRLTNRLGPPNRNLIQFDINSDTIERDIRDDDNIVMDDMDLEEADKLFKTNRILMAREYSMDPGHIHKVNYAAIRVDEALADSGCERACSGPVAYDSYIKTLSQEDKALVREYEGEARFKFGGEGIFKSLKECLIPFYINGIRKFLRIDVVQADVPILLGLPVMKQLELGFQYNKQGGQDYGFFQGRKFKVAFKAGHHYISISKQGSINAMVEEDSKETQVFNTFIAHTRVFDEEKIMSQLRQLHSNYAHLPKIKMADVIKSAGQWKPEMSTMLDKIMEQCDVKKCRTKLNTQSTAKADFRTARKLGDVVTCDLKIRSSGKSIMYLIDQATSFCVAGMIENKSSQEVGRVLIRSWYGAGMPRISCMVSDNGKEWMGDEFASVLKRFSTVRRFTTPYHPNQNGLCERVHSVIDLNMQKMMEADNSLPDSDALIWAVLAYNNTPTFTGFAPAQLCYGVHNVLTPIQDLTPVECQEEDVTSRYLKDFKLRDEAILNHNQIRNSRKLREMLLSRSRPTVQQKPVGSWVWYRRYGDWQGPAQVAASLYGEAAVKEGNSWYTCRHNELLPLTNAEMERHGLSHLLEQDNGHDDNELANKPLSEPQVVELELSLPNLMPPTTNPASRQVDAPQDPENRLGSGSRRTSTDAGAAIPSNDSTSDQQTTDDVAGSQPVMDESLRSEKCNRKTPEDVEDDQLKDQGVTQSEPLPGVTADLGEVQQICVDNQIQEDSQADEPEYQSQARDVPSQVPSGFDPMMLQRPPVDVREAPLKKNQEVRIIHPSTKETQDVTICNGFKRANQKSWYRVVDQKGKKSVLDFNEIVWDYKANSNMFVKQARIDPESPFTVLHTIIHPSRHHLPPILEAKESEVKNHQKFGTFEKVALDSLTPEQQKKIIPAVWAVVWKGSDTAGKYKARLCARGDKEPNVESIRTDAPTASKDSIRILLSLAASMGWKLHSLDFQAAFCQGKDIERELYLNPPADIRRQNPGYVLKVIKRIYGLKDASRGWVIEVRDFLLQVGCIQSDMDKAVFYYRNEKGETIGMCVTHIDDFLYCGTPQFHEEVIQKVKDRYVIGAEEDTSMTFTGWQLKQSGAGIELSQAAYTDAIKLDKFKHFRSYTAKEDQQLSEEDQGMYRKMIGILNWLTNSSRPALAHACTLYSAHLGKATKAHGKAVYRLLEKAKSEPESIFFSNLGCPKDWKLDVFTDAAMGKAGTVDTFVGDIAFLNGKGHRNVINWGSSKLDIPSPTILIGEAEAVNSAYGKISYIRFILKEIIGTEPLATIYTDSKSLHAAVLSDNSIRNRRISAAVATIRAIKLKENIALVWVKGLANAADPLTKLNANPANLKHLLRTGKTLELEQAKVNEVDFVRMSFLG